MKFYGLEQTRKILHMFGADQLIFGTDYPEGNYEEYFSILDQMDFTNGDMKKITNKNIESILKISQ